MSKRSDKGQRKADRQKPHAVIATNDELAYRTERLKYWAALFALAAVVIAVFRPQANAPSIIIINQGGQQFSGAARWSIEDARAEGAEDLISHDITGSNTTVCLVCYGSGTERARRRDVTLARESIRARVRSSSQPP